MVIRFYLRYLSCNNALNTKSNIMKTIEIKVFTFDELSDEAKEVAVNECRDIDVMGSWWIYIYEDAETIGLRITSFELDRNRHAEGEFISDALECAHKITAEHGGMCETFKTAQAFLAERDSIVDSAELDENGEFVDESELDSLLDECEDDFLKSILEDYSIMLQKEFEYLQSDESAIETIRANGYEFLENGTMY